MLTLLYRSTIGHLPATPMTLGSWSNISLPYMAVGFDRKIPLK